MVKRLSEQLSDLSVHVKNAEDAASAAEKEAHDKIAARRTKKARKRTPFAHVVGDDDEDRREQDDARDRHRQPR